MRQSLWVAQILKQSPSTVPAQEAPAGQGAVIESQALLQYPPGKVPPPRCSRQRLCSQSASFAHGLPIGPGVAGGCSAR